MSKNKELSAEALFKKAQVFEKLALYSDRKSFLQSLSQAADHFTEEERHQWENTDELGNPKNYMSYPEVKKDPSATAFTPEEQHQWDNTDELGNPKQTGIPAVPSATPAAPATQSSKQNDAMTSATWANKLIDTVNTYVGKAGPQTSSNLMDPHREELAKQLDTHAIAELVRLYNKLGGSDNPYTAPEAKALAEKIKETVNRFGQTFSGIVSSLPHYNQL